MHPGWTGNEDDYIGRPAPLPALDTVIPMSDTGDVLGPARPRIVCLVGSCRFYKHFIRHAFEQSLAGRIVLTIQFAPDTAEEGHHAMAGITPMQKEMLDQLHRAQVDLADEILVINPAGYVGDSTRALITHAVETDKKIRYMVPPFPPNEIERRRPSYESGHYF